MKLLECNFIHVKCIFISLVLMGKQFRKDSIVIPLDDGTQFAVKSVESNMDEAEYPGIRFKLEAALNTMKTPLKFDISADDVITPREVYVNYGMLTPDSIDENNGYRYYSR